MSMIIPPLLNFFTKKLVPFPPGKGLMFFLLLSEREALSFPKRPYRSTLIDRKDP
ncbi:hypothetical protein HMPREF1705_04741 [Acetomicrobium hydrogeniformans ATCC BAA-1850]|uniref:Uncharacterized protein n=1 Tax=Acetomicrobium hydrogeniformans ATCC BAA-1850 TaxID=592015 RepID=A0A0T5X8Y9_9BACT|nr:hypothetical protein HMPREF1705_04741 [Acetomicrobium hydrogeniformans ATCC BAA-1850]